jgi:hypothetical protein
MQIGSALVVAVLVIFMIGRRFVGSPVTTRSFVLPIVFVVLGAAQLQTGISPGGVAMLVAELVLGAAAGAARGYTIHLYEHEGHLWQKYTWITAVVWIALIGVRVGAIFAGHALGVEFPSGTASLFTVGASFLTESLVVNNRATKSGVPIAVRNRVAR